MDATKFRDRPHARLYLTWADLPTWRALSPNARALLAEILMRYRPSDHGRLQLPLRIAGDLLGVSKDAAGRALVELERNGWLAVAKPARFGGAHTPALYRLTMFDCPETGTPATHAYKFMTGERLSTDRKADCKQQRNNRDGVPLARLDSPIGRTPQSHGKDTGRLAGAPSQSGSIFKKRNCARRLQAQSPGPAEGPEIRLDTAVDIIASPSLAASLRRMRDRT